MSDETESGSYPDDGTEYVGILEGGWDDIGPELLAILRAFRLSCDDPAISQCPPRASADAADSSAGELFGNNSDGEVEPAVE
jgi:hypothetical protein